ncbi:MAG: hypothetical protein AB4042_00585 [Leptolyngbyaceae cyanobacterium]
MNHINHSSIPYGTSESVIGAYVPSEFIESTPTKTENQKPQTDDTAVANGLGLLLVSIFVVISGLSMISVTATLAEIWTNQAQQEINSHITPSTWRF